MWYKNLVLVCSAFCAVSLSGQAQSNLPTPYSSVDGGVVVSNFFTMDAPDTTEDIYVNALLWATNNVIAAEDVAPGPVESDTDAQQLSIDCALTSKKLDGIYFFKLSVRVADNILTTLASDINYQSEVAVVKFTKRTSFDKLQPDKKSKHKEYMDDFASLYPKLLSSLTEYISSHEPPTITHWSQISQNDVVKGMTEDECLLSLGRPVRKQEQGSKVQWIYDSYTYLFFEDGKLVSLIR